MMSTLTMHCQWEDEMVRERTGHLPSYTKTTGSVFVRVQEEDIYYHYDLKFRTYLIANGDETKNFDVLGIIFNLNRLFGVLTETLIR